MIGSAAFGREDRIPGSRYTSGRGAALGDAYINLADDAAAGLFYNPAALSRDRGVQVQPLNMSIGFNQPFLETFSALQSYKITSLASFRSHLATQPRTYPGVSGSYLPNVAVGTDWGAFGAGLLLQSEFYSQSLDQTSELQYRSRYELVPAVGVALRLARGIVRAGYSLQWVNKAVGEANVPFDQADVGYTQGLKQGSALSHNFGFSLTLPVQLLPSANVVFRNIGGAKYTDYTLFGFASNPTGVPDQEPMSIDAGMSISPRMGKGTEANISVVARDCLGILDDWQARLSLGLELNIQRLFYVRVGYGSGYPSVGLGLRRKRSDFSITWYSEELGTSLHERREIKGMIHYMLRAF